MLRLLPLLTLALFALAAGAQPLRLNLDTVAVAPGTPEGVWRMASGAVFQVSARDGRPGVYDLAILHSPDLTVAAGTHFGTLAAGADSHTFDASLLADTRLRSAGRARRHSFEVKFDDDFAAMTFIPYRKGVSVNLIRLIPYLFRVSVERHENSPEGVIGARRCDGNSTDYPITL